MNSEKNKIYKNNIYINNMILNIENKSFKVTIIIKNGNIIFINSTLNISLKLLNLIVIMELEIIKIPNYNIEIYSFFSKNILILTDIFAKNCILRNNIKYFYTFYNVILKTFYSTIYYVNDKKYKLDLVCKVIKKNQNNLKELFILKSLNSTNIIKIKQSFINDNYIYIIQNYYYNIKDFILLKKYKSYPIICLRVVKGLLNGLREMKNKNILHSDLSINNVLFKRINENMTELDVLIIDFGISDIIDNDIKQINFKGTKYFIEPVLISNKKIELNKNNKHKIFSLDIFSLGSIFYYWITNEFYNYKNISKSFKKLKKKLKDYFINYVMINGILDMINKMLNSSWDNRISIDTLINYDILDNIY